MSTQIKEFKGVKEDFLSENIVDTAMCLTRFWGGADKGRMLQLTIYNNEGYIQFTKEECIELAKTLLNAFDDAIHPSE